MIHDQIDNSKLDFNFNDDILVIKARGVANSAEEMMKLTGIMFQNENVFKVKKIIVDYLDFEFNVDIIDIVEYINKMNYPEEFKAIKTCILVNMEMTEKAELWQNMNSVKDFPFTFRYNFEDAVNHLNE